MVRCDSDAAERDLTEGMELALQAMLELKAIDCDRRRSRVEIVALAEPDCGKPDSYKMTFTKMYNMGLIDRQIGRGGGSWLTPDGLTEATRIQKR